MHWIGESVAAAERWGKTGGSDGILGSVLKGVFSARSALVRWYQPGRDDHG